MAKKRINNKTVLFVEGTQDTSNGELRRGFRQLISQANLTGMPRIIMGGNKPETIKKFIKSPFDAQNVLLIDLDNPRSELEADIVSENLQAEQAKGCYMIQEMEAWLLSQPDILDAYYQDPSISRRMRKRSPAEIPDPKAEL